MNRRSKVAITFKGDQHLYRIAKPVNWLTQTLKRKASADGVFTGKMLRHSGLSRAMISRCVAKGILEIIEEHTEPATVEPVIQREEKDGSFVNTKIAQPQAIPATNRGRGRPRKANYYEI